MKRILITTLLSASTFNTFAYDGIEDMPNYIKSQHKGRVKSVIMHLDDGAKQITNYDPNGWELNVIRKDKDGSEKEISKITYDKLGRAIKQADTYTYAYNSQNQLESRTEYASYGKTYSELEYTPSGEIFRAIYYRTRGTHDVLGVFHYDGNGKKSEIHSFKSGSKGWWATGVVKYEYNDTTQRENMYNIGRNDTSLTLVATNVYDKNNNKTKEYVYHQKGDSIIVMNPWTWEFDKNGNQTKRVRIKDKDTIIYTTEYVYDKIGNILEMTQYKNGEKTEDSIKYEYIYYPDNTPIKKEPAKYKGTGPTASLENQGKWKDSFEKLKAMATAGNVNAQSRLGYYYLTGTGTPFNISKAFEWLKKAAEGGNAEAQYQLGFLYLTGTGVEKSEGFANEWMLKAAKQGHKKAYYDVAIYYLDSFNDNADIDQALEYLKKSAATGNTGAKNLLEVAESNLENITKIREEQKKRKQQ